MSCSTDAKNASMSRCSTQRESTITDAIALTSLSMAMNLCHRVFCSSHRYFDAVEGGLLPWVLADVDLGDNVLEIGPGYGANIRVLIDKAPHYTAVEIDPPMADRLEGKYGDRARLIQGDGTNTGLPAEAFRVLRPGGVFAGSDSAASTLFRLFHFR